LCCGRERPRRDELAASPPRADTVQRVADREKKGGPLGVAWPCRVFSNFGDGSRSTPHRDRAIGADVFSGAKRIVVRCGGCRKSTERLSGEPHADRHAANAVAYLFISIRSCAKPSPQMPRPYMLQHNSDRGTEAARCIQQRKSQNWPRARGPINLSQFARKISSAL